MADKISGADELRPKEMHKNLSVAELYEQVRRIEQSSGCNCFMMYWNNKVGLIVEIPWNPCT